MKKYIINESEERDELYVLEKDTGDFINCDNINLPTEKFPAQKTLSGNNKINVAEVENYYVLGHYKIIYGKIGNMYPIETIPGYEVMIPVEFDIWEKYSAIIREKSTHNIIAVKKSNLLNVLNQIANREFDFGKNYSIQTQDFFTNNDLKRRRVKFRFYNYYGNLNPWIFQTDILERYCVQVEKKPYSLLGIAVVGNGRLVKPIKIGKKYYATDMAEKLFKTPYPAFEGWENLEENVLSDGETIIVFYPIEKVIDEICLNNLEVEKNFILSLAKRKIGKIVFSYTSAKLTNRNSIDTLKNDLVFSTKQKIKKILNDLV